MNEFGQNDAKQKRLVSFSLVFVLCYLSFLTNACFRLGALPRLEFPFVHSVVFVFFFRWRVAGLMNGKVLND